jgi:hypothetical protein
MVMAIKDLAPNPKNPRKITDARLQQLKKALYEFGDLGGFIFNRSTKSLVGGHQRSKLFDRDTEIRIEERYKKPTRTGTVAEGFVLLDGERHRYREVVWDAAKEKAAAIAANRNAGDWDNDLLRDWLVELDSFDVDLDLTMLDEFERNNIFKEAKSEDKPSKDKKSRSASDEVKGVNLVFTNEGLVEFQDHVEHFQKILQIDSITDTILEVFRSARAETQAEPEVPSKPGKQKAGKISN